MKLTTAKIKKITKCDGNVIDLNYYLQYRRHKNNYNFLLREGFGTEHAEMKLRDERLSAIECYNLAFILS